MPKNKKNWQNPRLAAIQALSEVLDENKNLGDSHALSSLRDSRDNALARNLAYGVLRWMSSLEWLAGELLSKPITARKLLTDISKIITKSRSFGNTRLPTWIKSVNLPGYRKESFINMWIFYQLN